MTDNEFARRLEKLERDNRRLRQIAFAGIALAAALGILYSVACSSGRNSVVIKPDAERVAAREFDMVDSAGKVRVKIAMNCSQASDCRPEIRLMDAATDSGEQKEASLLGDRLQFSVNSKGSSPTITAQLGSGSGGGGLLSLQGNGGGSVEVNANAPSIEIKDAQGYVMDLGASDLTTVMSGKTSQTTADSIVMFANDNKHHLIWSAP
jgi:hypothetical protein